MITLAPNPTRDYVTVTMSSGGAYIEVIDGQGKLLQALTLQSGGQVNVSDYTPGVYLFRVRTENGTTTHRIVKN